MNMNYYRQVIETRDNDAIGVALGIAIKDDEITSKQYAELCREALLNGFKFRYIVFSS